MKCVYYRERRHISECHASWESNGKKKNCLTRRGPRSILASRTSWLLWCAEVSGRRHRFPVYRMRHCGLQRNRVRPMTTHPACSDTRYHPHSLFSSYLCYDNEHHALIAMGTRSLYTTWNSKGAMNWGHLTFKCKLAILLRERKRERETYTQINTA